MSEAYQGGPVGLRSRRVVLMGVGLVFAAVAIATVGVIAFQRHEVPVVATRSVLQLRAVDDGMSTRLLERATLPRGGSLIEEKAWVGGERRVITAVRIVATEGETVAAALARAKVWAASVSVPTPLAIGFTPWFEMNDDGDRSEQAGWSTVILSGDAAVTEADIVDAQARVDSAYLDVAFVDITFSPAGAERLARATREWTGNRMGVIVDGVVVTVPVVQSEVSGGSAQITMSPQKSPEQQLREARALAASLRAQP